MKKEEKDGETNYVPKGTGLVYFETEISATKVYNMRDDVQLILEGNKLELSYYKTKEQLEKERKIEPVSIFK